MDRPKICLHTLPDGDPRCHRDITVTLPLQTVVLDVDLSVQLFSLVIHGTLLVESRAGASVFVRTTCITIKYGGRLLAGRPSPALTGTQSSRPAYVDSYPAGSLKYLGEGPFLGRLEILLSGDDMTAAPQCDGMNGGFSGRKLVNEGHMALHGARPTMVWSVLRYTAAAGAWKLTVQGDAGWLVGDVILVASTDDDDDARRQQRQTETKKVLASRLVPAPGGGWDTEVGLDSPLSHAHHGETEIHNGHTLELRAEVGVISRPSIQLAGVAAWSKCHPLAVPQLGSCGSSGRAWWLWAARHSQSRGRALGRPVTRLGCSSKLPPKSPISLPSTIQASIASRRTSSSRRCRPLARV